MVALISTMFCLHLVDLKTVKVPIIFEVLFLFLYKNNHFNVMSPLLYNQHPTSNSISFDLRVFVFYIIYYFLVILLSKFSIKTKLILSIYE